MNHDLLQNLDQLHSTDLGAGRIRKNLELNVEDVVLWCKEKIRSADGIIRKGKNWYVHVDDVRITVNAHSFTIITAHKEKGQSLSLEIKHVEKYTKEELRVALRATDSTIGRCEKVRPKLRESSSQHTLLVRRIKTRRR